MARRILLRSLRVFALALSCSFLPSVVQAQGAKQVVPQNPIPDSDADHVKQRNEWFLRGRLVHGKSSADLRRRAYQAKLQIRARTAAVLASEHGSTPAALPPGSWTPLGPVPLASDASGDGTQDYHQVAGRATAIAIDPADPTGNTIYVGGAQSGIWKSTNATTTANSVNWTPVTDDQATLSIGAIAIQPGNLDPAKTVILAATGEANNSEDSYFGLGILRSADAGETWALLRTANSGGLSFSGLGGTRMAFSAAGSMNTVVAAMATTSEGMADGAVTAQTMRGLYTSLDAGLTWTYNALRDSGVAIDATSATSVVYNSAAGLFVAAVRYHGFYSSPDGTHWTRLTNQPGGTVLSPAACPAQSSSNNYACPIYRAEIAIVPGRNEIYIWSVSIDVTGNTIDQGIWRTKNGGSSWVPISDAGITNCGDVEGCGVQQGSYNLELLAVSDCPNGTPNCLNNPTDLYAGAINLYKCSIPDTNNPVCSAPGFLNLTHVYGCNPIGAPAHVHPDQHALAGTIPTSGSDSGNALLYFANDGGIYRSLDGFLGLNTGDCSGTNEFEDLNQNLGSMTQFVSFSQHPSDPNTLLGGTQDNGSPATAQAMTSTAWVNVLGGDGGYNAIDPASASDWYASNPDIPPGGLGIQYCASGVNCNNSLFNFVVTSSSVGDDDGAFYFPYMLDPSSSTAMLVGTCRVWRGSRAGGLFTAVSPNFESLGSGTCSGAEINQVRALAAGGQADSNGSNVIYATTSGLGPTDGPTTPQGGRVWVTTNASAGPPAFADVTDNGPQGNINPNQFPVSGVGTEPSDRTGNTAYVTVMGFTGGLGHVWKTASAGAAWIDFTGNLPDSPVNAVIVDSALSQVYVATDVGVFASSTAAPRWTELGPIPNATSSGFLPNVAVTALGLFASGGQHLLRAATYGRGMWEFDLASKPDFQISLTNSPQTISAGGTATFIGLASALDGYSGTVKLSCVAAETPAPSTCSSAQSPLTPALSTPFTVTAGGSVGDYYFNVQGVGSDSKPTSHLAAAELHILSGSPDFGLTENGAFPTVNAGSSTASGPINVTASNGFGGTISLTCALVSGNGSCSANPATVTSIPTTSSITVNATALSAGNYQLIVHGTSGASSHTLLISFKVADFQVTGPQSLLLGPGTAGTANLTVTGTAFYAGTITSTCSAPLPGATCTVTPSPTTISTGSSASLVATVSLPGNAAIGTHNVNVNVADTSGMPVHSVAFPLTVQDFTVSASPATQSVNPGAAAAYSLTIQPVSPSFNSAITLSCPSGLPAGTHCAFQPSTPVTPGASPVVAAVTIATAGPTTPGTYTVTLTGSSGSLAHSTTAGLTVKTPIIGSGDFQLAATQSFPAGIAAGAKAQASVSVTSNYRGSVTATCDAISISGQCTVTPSPLAISANAPSNLVLAVNVPNTIMPAPYNINLTVTDSSKQLSHTLQLPLAVIPDFTVNSGTPTQTIAAGQTTSGPYQLTVAPNPTGSLFEGEVTLSCRSGLPAGAQCLFAPSTPLILGDSSAAAVMTISISGSKVARRSHSGPSILYAMWLLVPGLICLCGAAPTHAKSKVRLLCFAATMLLICSTLSCGGVSNGGGSSTTRNQPTTHQIIITGTSPGTTVDAGQSTMVTLVID